MLCYTLDAIAVGDVKEAKRSVAVFLGKYKDSPHAAYIREKLRVLLSKEGMDGTYRWN